MHTCPLLPISTLARSNSPYMGACGPKHESQIGYKNAPASHSPAPLLHGHMEGFGEAACARWPRVRGGFPHKRPLLAVAVVGPLHPIASIPCGHHRLEAAAHFPPPLGCLPMWRWKFQPTFHWAPQLQRTGPTSRLPMVDWHGRVWDKDMAAPATIWSQNSQVYARFVWLYFLRSFLEVDI